MVVSWYLFFSHLISADSPLTCVCVYVSDDILGGELFKAISSTLGQFSPLGIFDWENGG